MKKLIVFMAVLAMFLNGCAMLQHPCTQAGQAELTKAQIVVSGIQEYYNPSPGVGSPIPTVGPTVAVAVSLALSTADQALKILAL